MSRALVASLVLLVAAAWCSAQDLPAGCPQRMALKDFNATAYMGKWYEYAKFGDTPYEADGVCVTAEYKLDGDNVTVLNSMLINKTRERDNKTAWADFKGPDNTVAMLSVHFKGSPVGGMYWVLSTDYHNYSIVWACEQPRDGSGVVETSWILLRNNTISNVTKEVVEKELQQVNIPLKKYMMTEQGEEQCSGAVHLLATSIALLVSSLVALLR